jgi:ribosomal protein L44E
MPEHQTKNTETVTAYCASCRQNTQHRVDGGRQGPCIDPDHHNPLRTIPGEKRFLVRYLNPHDKEPKQRSKTFEKFDEALAFYARYGPQLATLWETSNKTPEKLR